MGSLPASHPQGSHQDFLSPADPHSPPHCSARNRQQNFARQLPGQQLCDSGVNGFLDISVKSGSCSRVRRCESTQPRGRPAAAPARSSPFQSPLPSGSPSVLSRSCSSGDLFSGLTPFFGGGNGNPLQYPCLENPMDRGAWRATVRGVAKSRTRLITEDAGTPFFTGPPKTAASLSPL